MHNTWAPPKNSNISVRGLLVASFNRTGQLAITTAHPLDPLRGFYFELTVTSPLSADYPVPRKLAVGLGPNKEFPPARHLPGGPGWTYGYHSDSGCFCVDGKAQDQPKRPFGKKDDIVGCGISTDGQVYFTLNGALIGFATPGLDRTKRFFGVVGFEGSIQFETNFGATPFAFDHLSLIPERDQQGKGIADLPPEIMLMIFSRTAERPTDMVLLGQVSKAWHQFSDDNNIWRKLFFARWTTQNKKLKIKAWGQFYKRRHLAFKEYHKPNTKELHSIENCEWEFQCPLLWESLTPGVSDYGSEPSRMCQVCNERVYYVTDRKNLEKRMAQGQCVCLGLSIPVQRIKHRMMGKRCF
jgi:hypothetical protein